MASAVFPLPPQADERDQAARRVGQAAGHEGQLLVPPHEAGGARRQVVGRRHRRRAEPGGQGGGLRRGGDAQFGGQHPPAERVVAQRGAPLALAREQGHQGPVGVLVPGVQLEQPAGERDPRGGRGRPVLDVRLEGRLERLRQRQAQALPLQGEPLVERRRVAHVRAGEELALVEAERGAGGRARRERIRARGDVRLERGHVDPVRARAVEGHPLRGHLHVLAHGRAQVGQGVADAPLGLRLAGVAGEEAGEPGPGVAPAGEGQVRQQGQRGAAPQRRRPASQADRRHAEQAEVQFGHGRQSPIPRARVRLGPAGGAAPCARGPLRLGGRPAGDGEQGQAQVVEGGQHAQQRGLVGQRAAQHGDRAAVGVSRGVHPQAAQPGPPPRVERPGGADGAVQRRVHPQAAGHPAGSDHAAYRRPPAAPAHPPRRGNRCLVVSSGTRAGGEPGAAPSHAASPTGRPAPGGAPARSHRTDTRAGAPAGTRGGPPAALTAAAGGPARRPGAPPPGGRPRPAWRRGSPCGS